MCSAAGELEHPLRVPVVVAGFVDDPDIAVLLLEDAITVPDLGRTATAPWFSSSVITGLDLRVFALGKARVIHGRCRAPSGAMDARIKSGHDR